MMQTLRISASPSRLAPRTLMVMLMLALSLALAGCGSSSSSSRAAGDPAPLGSQLEILHAVPDAPAVNIFAGGASLLSNVPYKAGSALLDVTAGPLEVRVEAIVPGGNLDVIGPVTLDLPAAERITLIAIGTVADIAPLIVTAPLAMPDPDAVRLQVVHAAPNAPMVDVYATAPGADLTSVAPVGTFAFGEALPPISVPAGSYQVRVTPASDVGTVVFDSGALDLAGGADLVISAVQNTGPGTSPISLVALTGSGVLEIFDVATPAHVRVIHASPDAPAVDVIGNDSPPPAFNNLAYGEFSSYLPLPAGDLNVKVVPTGELVPAVIDADLSLVAGFEYSVYAVDFLADISALVLVDDNRGIATETRVRILHASPSAGPVDIYVVAAGDDFTLATPAFSNVPFLAETGYVALPPDAYDVYVTPTGTLDVALSAINLDLQAGNIYTAVARDAVGGGTPLGLILLDDF